EERRLCYVAMTRARQRLVLTSAARRRTFGEYRSTVPSRFLAEVPPDLMELAPDPSSEYQRGLPGVGVYAGGSAFRRTGYGARRVRETPSSPFPMCEDEDQSAGYGGGIVPGARVRHAHFGVGTVVSVEPVSDDTKIVVRFAIGEKVLRAKYARLQPA